MKLYKWKALLWPQLISVQKALQNSHLYKFATCTSNWQKVNVRNLTIIKFPNSTFYNNKLYFINI